MANSITTSGTGASDGVILSNNDHVLIITWAGSAGDADLQAGHGATFVDVTDQTGAIVNVTSNTIVRVAGGLEYRLDVNTHTSAATMTAIQCEGVPHKIITS